ncbi:hypothetical protein GCM10007049_13540 [Echinicola pacifica]|uniref:Uncharacterized protein n=1 Tax=Echinicola pacifica TaxID=346377 RepID=A0A918PUV0_9BACT|nr:UPF0158 family protein [Echinicola pacifica]GGZ22050.1 hypothetical protein GCM10007049_13540 [Echinicola pacifica]
MLTLTDKEIDSIAHLLLKGKICYYQEDKKVIHHLPDEEENFNENLTLEEEDLLDEIDSDPDNYAEFVKMEPAQESYIMDQFAENFVENKSFQEDLYDALTKSKAMERFTFLIEESGKYHTKWQEFRLQKYKDWVLEQIDSYNTMEE